MYCFEQLLSNIKFCVVHRQVHQFLEATFSNALEIKQTTVVPDKLEHLPYDLEHCQIQATWSCYLSIVGCRKKYLNKQRWLLIGPVCIKIARQIIAII